MAVKLAAFSILVAIAAAAVIHVDTKTSCRLCQPGYHMVRKCKDKQPNTTRCARCPANSYTDLPNTEKGCYPHRRCNATSEVMTFPGNATHDAICKPCDQNNHPCKPSQECPPGKGVEITDADLSIEKAIHTFEDDSIKLEERKWLIINTVLTALILMLVLGFLVFIRSKETCSQRTYEVEGHVALPVQCEDTHPKELEASSSVDSRWSAATHLLPDQSTTVTRLSSSTLSTHDANEWSPMIPPTNVEDTRETQTDNRSACYGFPVADGFHTLPKASSSAHMASHSRQHLPFRPMSCSTDTIPSTLASSHETSASSLEYKQKINSTLARSYSNILTASATEELKTSLGDQWPELARRLKLKEYQIDQIVNENRSDLQGQIYNMLRCWQQRKTGEATIPELYGALKQCNRLDIIHKLQAMEDNS